MLCHGMVGGVYEHYGMIVIDKIVADLVLDLAIRISMYGVIIQTVTFAIYDTVNVFKNETAFTPVFSVYPDLEALYIAGSAITN
jgi:hypothetical protein